MHDTVTRQGTKIPSKARDSHSQERESIHSELEVALSPDVPLAPFSFAVEEIESSGSVVALPNCGFSTYDSSTTVWDPKIGMMYDSW